MIFHYITLAGLLFGTLVGFIGFVRPAGIAHTLRLQADPTRPGGFAEFRASFGGIFIMIHMTGLVFAIHLQQLQPALVTFVVAPIAMAWFGAAVGRLVSMLLDKQENGEGGNNRYWVVLEIIVGLMISATFLQLAPLNAP